MKIISFALKVSFFAVTAVAQSVSAQDPILYKYFQLRVTLRSNLGILIGQLKSRDLSQPIKMLEYQRSIATLLQN